MTGGRRRIAWIVAPPAFVVLALIWFVLWQRGFVGPLAFALLLLASVPLTWALVLLIRRVTAGTAGES